MTPNHTQNFVPVDPNRKKLVWKEAATGGLYLGLALVAVMVISYLGRMDATLSWVPGLLNFAALVLFILFYARKVSHYYASTGFYYPQSLAFILKMMLFAGVLAAIGIAYFLVERKKTVPGIVSVLLIVGLCFALPTYSFAFWEKDITLEDESIYNYLQVKEDKDRTILSTNVLFGVQSIQMKSAALTGMYYDYALAAPCMAGMDGTDSASRSVMILGMGSGTYASYCDRYFPGAAIQGAEIDGKIADIAHAYFGLPETVEVAVEDGRAYLAASDALFDVIMVDAYQDITIPFQMSTVEFFSLVADHLTEDGVMVVNMNMHSDGEGSINAHLSDTISSVFENVYTADVPRTTNRELFAWNGGDALESLKNGAGATPHADLREMMEDVSERLTPYEAGDLLLTDDKAPVELLGMDVIDTLIQDEVALYRDIYEEEGLSGVIDSLL